MPSVVTIPGVGEVEFPDSLSPSEISSVAENLWLEAGDSRPRPSRLTDDQLKDPAAVKAYVDALNQRSEETRQAVAARDAQPLSDQPQGFWKTVRQPLADPALSLAKGVVGVPEAVVGLADIPTGGRVGKALEESIGYDPKFTKEWLSRFYSPEQQAANEEVAKAKGFFNTVRAMGENPSTVVNQVAESIPTMLGGAAIGRGALALAPRIGPVVAGALGEGAVTAGQTAEQLRQESESGLLTPKQSMLSATSGAATGLIGVLGGGLARRLGITDIDTLLAGGRAADAAAKKNILRRVVESALAEGALEELPQGAQEQIQRNVASGRPWDESVSETSAQSLAAGLVMGGAGGGLAGVRRGGLRGRESILRRGTVPVAEMPRVEPPAVPPIEIPTVAKIETVATVPPDVAPTPPTPPATPTAPAGALADAGGVADRGIAARPFVIEREGVETSKFGVPQKDVPKGASGFQPPPLPERFETLEDALKYREAQEKSEIAFFKSLGLSDSDARKMFKASDSRSRLDVSSIEEKLTPENAERLAAYDTGEGKEVYQWDRMYDPTSLTGVTDRAELAQQIVANLQRESQPTEFGDKLIHAAVALRQLKNNGGTWRDIATALDKFTTRNSGSQGDKAEFFESLANKIKAFAARQGIELPLEPSKQIATPVAVPEVGVAEVPKEVAAKTRLDLILDEVEKTGEVTVKLENGATREQVEKVSEAASARGMIASFDGNNFLIRRTKPLNKKESLALEKRQNGGLTKKQHERMMAPALANAEAFEKTRRKEPLTPEEAARLNDSAKRGYILEGDLYVYRNPETQTPELPSESGRVVEPSSIPEAQPREVTVAETPPQAQAKMQAEVSSVAKTEGARPAKEIKSELVQRLEEALAKAPEVDFTQYIVPSVEQWRTVGNKRRAYKVNKVPLSDVLSNPEGWKVQKWQLDEWKAKAGKEQSTDTITIEIPGDGTFKVPNTKPNLQGVLERAKQLATNAGSPPTAPRRSYQENDYRKLQFTDWTDPKVVPALEAGLKTNPALYGALETAKKIAEQPGDIPTSFRETAEFIAGKLESLKSGRQAGDLQLFGVIPAVWDAAISIAQGIIRAGGTAADAIAAALAHIRANQTEPFEEAQATEFINGVVQPQTQFTEPDANEAEPAAAQTVNIAGRTYEVISKDKLTEEQRKAADGKAQAKFAELGIPGAPDATDDRRAGSINNNTVFRVVSDGQNHDAAVQALRTHLVDEIQRQHSQWGDPAYVGSLINAINMNFDHGRWQEVVSQPVLESLLDVSVGESSKSGTMLRRFRGISEDIRAVAQNAALRLKWEYAQALDPDNYAKGALTRVVEGIRRHFTENEITSLARKIAKPEDAEPVVAAIRKAIAGDFASVSDVMKAAQAALIEAGMTEPQARKIVSEAETILRNTVRDGANAAIAQMREELTPAEKRGAAGRALGEIQKLMLNDVFGYGDLLTRLAKGERWVVPSAKEFEQMRDWAKREEALRTPTADEIARAGSVETATEMVSAATLGVRRNLLRQMNSQWSQWTNPLVTNWRDIGDAVKVKNTNMAFNEWVAANLLFKVGFATRQTWDVLSQMLLNTPTRAISYAFEAWQNDKAAGRDSSLQHNIAEAIGDAYRARFKVLVPALNAFKETLAGRGEHRKQVEQLISSIGIFDRALANAAKMRSENKRGAANLLEIIAITARMGRQFAAAMDMFQGIPAETQELAHQIRNALREKMPPGVALEVQYDSIMGILTAQRAEAISLARDFLEARRVEAKGGELEMAANRILREKLYHAAKQAGLKTDDWKKNNELYRDLIGWNLPETGGVRAPGGFGGLVSLGGKAAREMLSNVPLLGGVMSVPFTFANAMGISLNRKLAWSPLGFFPGLFTGSPHWTGETNIRQRKIEAALGTGISATVFSLIVAGVWKALPAFWPKDDKERERWVQNGWAPGMVLIPWGNGQELHVSTRVGPLAFFSPAIAAAAAYTAKVEERVKKQAVSDARAKRMGLKPEPLPDLSAADWMGIMFAAGYSSVTGGRTASGALAAYSDYGTFNIKKAAASVTGAVLPGLPALNEFGRMAGGNINPKLATFWDLLVPMPTSDAQRVNMLGDPMRDENDYRRVFQILSGGNFPFPTSATPAETQAYAALFESDYRPPAINPGRGYNIGGRYRPFTADELGKYTALRGQNFKRELGALGASPSGEEIKAAFVRANDEALASVGVAVPVRRVARAAGRTRSTSRLRLGRTRRGGLRGLRSGRRGLRGLRRRRKRLVLR